MSAIKGKKVLIIDDSTYVREKLKSILEEMEMEIEIAGEAADGITGIEEYKRLKPDFVTLDVIMPNMDGIKVLKKLKEIDPNVVVIMISSVDSEHKMMEELECGAEDIILKPFKSEAVKAVVKETIKNRFTVQGPNYIPTTLDIEP